jgi:quaternary ammonium compound-resistance protein SugE
MAWAVLVGAGLLEIVWAIALKHADGFTRLWPSALGIGALGVALAGIVALGESASLLRLGFLALILAGMVGLKLVEG